MKTSAAEAEVKTEQQRQQRERWRECERLRSRGNKLFTDSSSEALPPVIRRDRAQKACRLYLEALNRCGWEWERAKCCKNLGAGYWRLTKLGLDVLEDNSSSGGGRRRWQDEEEDKALSFNAVQCVKYYLAALEHGRSSKQPAAWVSNIEATVREVAETLVQRTRRSMTTVVLEEVCKAADEAVPAHGGRKSQASAVLHRARAEQLLQRGVRLLRRSRRAGGDAVPDFKGCMALMAECHHPIKVAEAVMVAAEGHDEEFAESVRALRSRVSAQQLLCESIQARVAGDKYLQQATDAAVVAAAAGNNTASAGNKIKSLGYLAVDKYKEAANLAKGVDIEAEAEALCGVANVYTAVLKMERTALPYYESALELLKKQPQADAAAAPNDYEDDDNGEEEQVRGKEWVKRARAALQRLRNRMYPPKAAAAAAEQEKRMRQAAEEVKGVVADLDKECKKLSAAEFLVYVCKHHPPRKTDVKSMQPGNERVTRIALRRAISAYHPDRNAGEFEVDAKWAVLCQEITKQLLLKYKGL